MNDDRAAPDSEIVERAREFIRRMQSGEMDEAMAGRGSSLPERLRFKYAEFVGPLGEPSAVTCVSSCDKGDGFVEHLFTVTFRSGKVRFVLGCNPEGRINRYGFSPIPGEPSPLADLITIAKDATSRKRADTSDEQTLSEIRETWRRRLESLNS